MISPKDGHHKSWQRYRERHILTSHVTLEIYPAVEKSLKDQLRNIGKTHKIGSKLEIKMISPKDGHFKIRLK